MRTLAPQETTFWGLNQARSLAADEMQTHCRVSAQSGDNQPSQPCTLQSKYKEREDLTYIYSNINCPAKIYSNMNTSTSPHRND